jgi:hypothetical protein
MCRSYVAPRSRNGSCTGRRCRVDRGYIGADVEECLEVAAVAGFTTGEMKCDGQAAEICLQVNLGRKSTA